MANHYSPQDYIQPSGSMYYSNQPGAGRSMQGMPAYDPSKLDASYAMGPYNYNVGNVGGSYMSAATPAYHHSVAAPVVAHPQHAAPAMYSAHHQPHYQFPQVGQGNLRSEHGIVRDVVHGQASLISERITEQKGNDYYLEKFMEVPTTIVREREREVRKPAIIERIIEVPKPELRYIDRPAAGGDRIIDQELIVEVPQIITEEIVTRVPRKEIQERLIEIPKIEYVERIEYDDQIEYREVCVDKIVEVPEVEYHIREVEKLVPQQYIEEYFVDNYREVPMYQVQEVERVEHVPVARQQPVMDLNVMMVPKVEAKRKGHWVYVDEGVEMQQSFEMVKSQKQVGAVVEQVNQSPAGGFLSYGYSSMPMKGAAQPTSPQQSGFYAAQKQPAAAYPSGAYQQAHNMQPSYGSYAAYNPQQAYSSGFIS